MSRVVVMVTNVGRERGWQLSLLGVATLCACSSSATGSSTIPTPISSEDDVCIEERPLFELDETSDLEVVQPPWSQEFQRGLDAYEAGAYEEAALIFAPISRGGGVEESPEGVQLGQFFLAKTLFHMGFFHSTFSTIEEILENREGLFLERTVLLLAVLSQRLPSEHHVISAMSRLPLEMSPPTSLNDELNAYVSFLLGKAAYQQNDFARARRLLSSVNTQWQWSVEARFYLALTSVRERRPHEALRAFQDMGASAIRQEQCGISERRALRDLAALSIGRLLYSGARTEDAFRAALRAYAGVGSESSHWSQATFERAWVHFQLGEDERSLTLIESLPEAFVTTNPEVSSLHATIALARCDLDRAQELTTAFHQRWPPVLEQLRAMAESAEALSRPPLGTLAGEIALQELESRSVARARDCLASLDAEMVVYDEMSSEFRDGHVGEMIRMDATIVRSNNAQSLTEQIRMRYRRKVETIENLLEEMTRLEAGVQEMRTGTPCSRW